MNEVFIQWCKVILDIFLLLKKIAVLRLIRLINFFLFVKG